MRLDIKITAQDMDTLENDKGYKKGKVVEKVVCCAMAQLGMPFLNYTEVKDQIKQGDYVVQSGDELKDVEIKSISNYGLVDRLYMDVYYYNIVEGNKVKQYKQMKSTGHCYGWLYTCEADWLVGFNYRTGNMYIIKNFQKFKKTMMEYVQLSCFADKIRALNYMDQYNNKTINQYMSWYINKNDKGKKTLTLTTELSTGSFEAFNMDVEKIKINLIVS